MNTNKIHKIIDLFKSGEVSLLDNDVYYVRIMNLTHVIDSPKNEVLTLKWEDDNGEEYSVVFTEKQLNDAVVHDNFMIMKDGWNDQYVFEVRPIKYF